MLFRSDHVSGSLEDLGSAAKDVLNGLQSQLKDQDKDISTASYGDLMSAWLGRRVKPFRNYELVTSMHDIIANSISCDHTDTFNSIELHYSDGDVQFNKFGQGAFETLTVNADDNIKEHHIRRNIESYPNCSTTDLAKRYASQLLANSLKKTYKGSLLTIGRPYLKPYDTVWLWDNYSDMAGPVEIEEVVHSFSQETGLTSDIIPNMIVTVKSEPQILTTDAISLFFAENLKDFTQGALLGMGLAAGVGGGLAAGASLKAGEATASAAMAANAKNAIGTYSVARGVVAVATDEKPVDLGQFAGGVVTGAAIPIMASIAPITVGVGAIMAGYAMYKIMKYNSTREPILVTPLIKDGKPFVTGLEGMETDGLMVTDLSGVWNTSVKKWKAFADGFGDAVELTKIGWINMWNE